MVPDPLILPNLFFDPGLLSITFDGSPLISDFAGKLFQVTMRMTAEDGTVFEYVQIVTVAPNETEELEEIVEEEDEEEETEEEEDAFVFVPPTLPDSSATSDRDQFLSLLAGAQAGVADNALAALNSGGYIPPEVRFTEISSDGRVSMIFTNKMSLPEKYKQ